MLTGIYSITCLANGRVYIGQAVNVRERFNQHRCLLRRGRHFNTPLQSAWNKYGEDRFEFSVAELVAEIEAIGDTEQRVQDDLRTNGVRLFNVRPTSATSRGVKYSEEAKAKLSAKAKEQFATRELRDRHGLHYRDGQPCRLRSPEGTIHEVANLSQFCREQGLSLSPLAKLAKGTLMSYRDWTNADLTTRKKKSNKLTEKQKQEAVSRYESGETTTVIAASMGVNPQSLGALLRRRGVKMRKPVPVRC